MQEKAKAPGFTSCMTSTRNPSALLTRGLTTPRRKHPYVDRKSVSMINARSICSITRVSERHARGVLQFVSSPLSGAVMGVSCCRHLTPPYWVFSTRTTACQNKHDHQLIRVGISPHFHNKENRAPYAAPLQAAHRRGAARRSERAAGV